MVDPFFEDFNEGSLMGDVYLDGSILAYVFLVLDTSVRFFLTPTECTVDFRDLAIELLDFLFLRCIDLT